MTKFYIHRTRPCHVTEIVEIEADSADAAIDAVIDGEGEAIGLSVGEGFGDETNEVFPAAPHNLPTGFLPINGEALLSANAGMLAALKLIKEARDCCAETGIYPAGLLGEDQEFDDWAADIADAAIALAEGEAT